MIIIAGAVLLVCNIWLLFRIIKKKFSLKWRSILAFTASSGAGAAFVSFFAIRFFGYRALVFFHDAEILAAVSLLYMLISILISESVKYVIFFIFIYPKDELQDEFSGIIISVLFAAFFFVFQNIFFAAPFYGFFDEGYRILLLCASMAGGAVFGYFLGEAKSADRKRWELHCMGAGASAAVNFFFVWLFTLKTLQSALLMAGVLIVIEAAAFWGAREKRYI